MCWCSSCVCGPSQVSTPDNAVFVEGRHAVDLPLIPISGGNATYGCASHELNLKMNVSRLYQLFCVVDLPPSPISGGNATCECVLVA